MNGPVGRIAPWLVKAVVAGTYWTVALYVLLGMLVGDRVEGRRIVAPAITAPPWILWLAALLLYAALSYAIDRLLFGRSARETPSRRDLG